MEADVQTIANPYDGIKALVHDSRTLHAALRRVLREAGVSPSAARAFEYLVLRHGAPGSAVHPVTDQQLADRLGVSRRTVTRIKARLAAAGLMIPHVPRYNSERRQRAISVWNLSPGLARLGAVLATLPAPHSAPLPRRDTARTCRESRPQTRIDALCAIVAQGSSTYYLPGHARPLFEGGGACPAMNGNSGLDKAVSTATLAELALEREAARKAHKAIFWAKIGRAKAADRQKRIEDARWKRRPYPMTGENPPNSMTAQATG